MNKFYDCSKKCVCAQLRMSLPLGKPSLSIKCRVQIPYSYFRITLESGWYKYRDTPSSQEVRRRVAFYAIDLMPQQLIHNCRCVLCVLCRQYRDRRHLIRHPLISSVHISGAPNMNYQQIHPSSDTPASDECLLAFCFSHYFIYCLSIWIYNTFHEWGSIPKKIQHKASVINLALSEYRFITFNESKVIFCKCGSFLVEDSIKLESHWFCTFHLNRNLISSHAATPSIWFDLIWELQFNI